MASDSTDTQDLTEGTHEPRECMACRGTGRVISNLGGSQSTVACPWCEGSGLRPGEIDAQAHWGPISEDAEKKTTPVTSEDSASAADSGDADGQSTDD